MYDDDMQIHYSFIPELMDMLELYQHRKGNTRYLLILKILPLRCNRVHSSTVLNNLKIIMEEKQLPVTSGVKNLIIY